MTIVSDSTVRDTVPSARSNPMIVAFELARVSCPNDDPTQRSGIGTMYISSPSKSSSSW